MKKQLSNLLFLAFLVIFPASNQAGAADQVMLQFNTTGDQGAVGMHSTLGLPVSSQYPEYTILRSTNLQTWEAVAGPVSGGVGV